MPVELDDREKIGAGLERVMDSLARESIGFMCSPVSHEAVHETRKNIKKLRTVIRLLRSVLGDEFVNENHALRDAGRLLSSARDAEVLGQTFTGVRKHCDSIEERRAFRRWRRRLLPAGAPGGDAVQGIPARRVARDLRAFARRARTWKFDALSQADFGEALRWIYKAGRDAARRVRSDPCDENFHEWRKRAKDLWHVALLLKPAWPEMMTAFASESKELSDRLGDDHDLAVLRERLTAAAVSEADSRDFAPLRDVIDKRRSRLQRSASTLAERIYLDKPNAFARRILGWWETDDE
jgi:CHAD domain-containing protein